jgi:hypothetical protein
MIDREWVDGDDAELENQAYSDGFSESLENARHRLATALESIQKALAEIDPNENSPYQGYFEGQVCAYEHAIAIVEGRE